ncbi:MAG: hypothetical protein KGJ59_00405 [Bacteroidota bacterium]|nr:hypothetical protein [Bacteroidota bacterium]
MQSIQDQQCPLCSNPARFVLIDHDFRKHFKCPVCIEFVISIKVEKYPEMHKSQYQARFSDLAKNAPKGEILDIRVKGTDVSADYVNRSTLLH